MVEENTADSWLSGFLKTGAEKTFGAVLDYGVARANAELDTHTPTMTTPPAGTVPTGSFNAGSPAPVTASDPRNFLVAGVPLNRTALYVAGGALALAVLVKVLK